ncbi:hypothetical protein TNCV_2434121 [Trichonephila clavipes]|nr:hypothetical protein TNCV_2434121 [Trichonephila clavipes]
MLFGLYDVDSPDEKQQSAASCIIDSIRHVNVYDYFGVHHFQYNELVAGVLRVRVLLPLKTNHAEEAHVRKICRAQNPSVDVVVLRVIWGVCLGVTLVT